MLEQEKNQIKKDILRVELDKPFRLGDFPNFVSKLKESDWLEFEVDKLMKGHVRMVEVPEYEDGNFFEYEQRRVTTPAGPFDITFTANKNGWLMSVRDASPYMLRLVIEIPEERSKSIDACIRFKGKTCPGVPEYYDEQKSLYFESWRDPEVDIEPAVSLFPRDVEALSKIEVVINAKYSQKALL